MVSKRGRAASFDEEPRTTKLAKKEAQTPSPRIVKKRALSPSLQLDRDIELKKRKAAFQLYTQLTSSVRDLIPYSPQI